MEKTILTFATSKSKSLRTTLPSGIVKHFNLNEGDILNWELEVKDNKIVVIVKPEKSKKIMKKRD